VKLTLQRQHLTAQATVGVLDINGVFECYTLEDVVREVPGQPVESWKIATQTAIPVGTYSLIIDFSNRFQRLLPRVLNVPGFEGIRVHAGNTPANTEGCILVGKRFGTDVVHDSRVALAALQSKLRAALDRGEKVELEVG